jgi:hypothetical protein
MNLKRELLFTALMSLTLTGFADTLRLRNGLQVSGMYEGGSSRILRFRTDKGIQEYDILTVFAVRMGEIPVANITSSFGPEQEQFIRNWFAKKGNVSRQRALPPGVQRELHRNGTLPPGLEERAEPLPIALEHQLPPIADGMHRIILAGNVILIEDATSRIVDLIRDVF